MSERRDRLRILLAEDNDDMRFLLRMAFDGSDFEIIAIAEDGTAAIEAWRDNTGGIDAVALDHRMPGPSGLEIAKMIRMEEPDVPVVLFSAELTRELEAQAHDAGIATLHKDDILRLPHHAVFTNARP